VTTPTPIINVTNTATSATPNTTVTTPTPIINVTSQTLNSTVTSATPNTTVTVGTTPTPIINVTNTATSATPNTTVTTPTPIINVTSQTLNSTVTSATPNTTVTVGTTPTPGPVTTATSQTLNTTVNVTSTTPSTTVAIIDLDLSNGSLTSIPPDLFKNQSHLQQVDLSNNQISYLTGSIFAALVNLEKLILSNNAIKTITVEVFRNLTNLIFLDLSQNAIRDLLDNLFVDNINLQVLNLDGNNISEVRRDTFVGLRSLKQLFLNASGLSSIHSSSFTPLVELKELYLQENNISFQIQAVSRIRRSFTANIFRNLRNLILLDLSKNSITFLPDNMFVDLIKLEVLRLDGNNFPTIRANTFTGLRSLQKLFLNDTGLSTIHPSSFLSTEKLKELYLQDNDMKFLPWDALQELNLTVLNLGNNIGSVEYSCDRLPNCAINNPDTPFSCCNDTMTCGVDSSIGLCMVKATVTTPLPIGNIVIIILMAILLTLFIIITILYCNRKYLQVWLYMKCGWRFDPKDDGDDKTYDAFISYSSRDELIVIRELAPGLEERGFKLCLHYRDFPVGACIATTIIETVEASRRTVILLSQNFVDSEWCALEFKAAHRQVLEDRRNRIVVIVLDDLELQNVDKDLKFYLKTNTYLKWGDPWFWSKLCYALPRVGRGAPDFHDLMSDEARTPDVNIVEPVQATTSSTQPTGHRGRTFSVPKI
ncbi:uncharacterized protein LOC144905584, partial [Branchiostoma floridae x Branchiostoma belcheri]